MSLSEEEIARFARHIVLPEIGGIGQERLLAARVLIVGLGGLGSPVALYLAAAGVGTLGLVDDDAVDLGNLQRQIVHDRASVGAAKTLSAQARIAAISPATRVEIHSVRLDPLNARELVRGYDIVADGSDNLATRLAVHDACWRQGRTLVSAAVQGVEGQLTVLKPHEGPPHPCLRCMFPEAPAPNALPSCAQGGVLGPAAGVMGCLQAVEVVKEVLGMAERSLSGSLLLYDALEPSLDRLRIARPAACRAGCVRLPDA